MFNGLVKSMLLGVGRTLIVGSIVPALLAAGAIKTTDVNNTVGSLIFLLGIAVPAVFSIWDKVVAKQKMVNGINAPAPAVPVTMADPLPQVTMKPIEN